MIFDGFPHGFIVPFKRLKCLKGVPPHGWFVREHSMKMDDLGGSPIFGNPHISWLLYLLCVVKENGSERIGDTHTLILPIFGAPKSK